MNQKFANSRKTRNWQLLDSCNWNRSYGNSIYFEHINPVPTAVSVLFCVAVRLMLYPGYITVTQATHNNVVHISLVQWCCLGKSLYNIVIPLTGGWSYILVSKPDTNLYKVTSMKGYNYYISAYEFWLEIWWLDWCPLFFVLHNSIYCEHINPVPTAVSTAVSVLFCVAVRLMLYPWYITRYPGNI